MKTNLNFSLSLNESVMNIKFNNSIELTIKLNEVINDINTLHKTVNSIIYLISSEHEYLELDKEQLVFVKEMIEELSKSNFTAYYKIDSDGHLNCYFNGEINLNIVKYMNAINNFLTF